MTSINASAACEIFDSRGNPTVEVEMFSTAVRQAGPLCLPALPPEPARPWNCATATRSGFGGKGVRNAVAAVNGEIAEALLGHGCARPAGRRPAPGRARRHREQGPPRRQRHPRRQPRRRQGGGRRQGLPLWRYVGGCRRLRAAGADDERHQWRRARRQPDRCSGIHDHAGGGADTLATACASARRSSTA